MKTWFERVNRVLSFLVVGNDSQLDLDFMNETRAVICTLDRSSRRSTQEM